MFATRSLKRWSVALAVAGALTGGTAGLMAQQAAEAAGGCTCTISGSGSYSCSTTSACGAGQFDCAVNCAS